VNWKPKDWVHYVNQQLGIDEHKGYDVAGECQCRDCRNFDSGANVMHKADVEWLKERVVDDDLTTLIWIKVSHEDWNKFTGG